jgi:hypothetical protein
VNTVDVLALSLSSLISKTSDNHAHDGGVIHESCVIWLSVQETYVKAFVFAL